jgi:hypothetical protein
MRPQPGANQVKVPAPRQSVLPWRTKNSWQQAGTNGAPTRLPDQSRVANRSEWKKVANTVQVAGKLSKKSAYEPKEPTGLDKNMVTGGRVNMSGPLNARRIDGVPKGQWSTTTASSPGRTATGGNQFLSSAVPAAAPGFRPSAAATTSTVTSGGGGKASSSKTSSSSQGPVRTEFEGLASRWFSKK